MTVKSGTDQQTGRQIDEWTRENPPKFTWGHRVAQQNNIQKYFSNE